MFKLSTGFKVREKNERLESCPYIIKKTQKNQSILTSTEQQGLHRCDRFPKLTILKLNHLGSIGQNHENGTSPFSSKIFIKINQMLQFPIQSWIAIF